MTKRLTAQEADQSVREDQEAWRSFGSPHPFLVRERLLADDRIARLTLTPEEADAFARVARDRR